MFNLCLFINDLRFNTCVDGGEWFRCFYNPTVCVDVCIFTPNNNNNCIKTDGHVGYYEIIHSATSRFFMGSSNGV